MKRVPNNSVVALATTEVWVGDHPNMTLIGTYVELLMPGRPNDRRLWVADVVDSDADGYDPIHLGVYDNPDMMIREMLEKAMVEV